MAPSPPDLSGDADEVLARFEAAWQGGALPRIEDYLPPIGGERRGGAPDRARLWEELVTIDLTGRLRCGASAGAGAAPPRLEDYAGRAAALGLAPGPSLDLVGMEYRARRHQGQRPGHAEYAARFPHYAAPLLALLEQIDAQVAAEQAPRSRPAAPGRTVSSPEGPASGPALPVTSTAALLAQLQALQLLGAAQRDEIVAGLPGRFPEAEALANELVHRGWLMPYQVGELVRGRGAALVLGPYRLLDRLGAGATGQVFKARHQHLDRLVALKVLRPELAADAEVRDRFLREMRLIGRLDHAHIISAYDAGRIADRLVLVMEYVAGVDLQRLVRERGPLPVAVACAYACQTALGLQHIHEHGLIHRDLKPSNLLLTCGDKRPACQAASAAASVREAAQVKILDLGLSRLAEAVAGRCQSSAQLTGPGAMLVGTPDFMAPEQALDFHAADVRSDLYSLGCTLYFLLTGRPPFAAAPLVEKLLCHQQVEPPSLRALRPDVPVTLAPIIGRLLAKRPEDRYQVPAEAAEALAPWCAGGGAEGPSILRASHPLEAAAAPEHPARLLMTGKDADDWMRLFDESGVEGASPRAAGRRRFRVRVNPWYVLGAVASLLMLGGGVWAVVSFINGAANPPSAARTVRPEPAPEAPTGPVHLRAALKGPDTVELTWQDPHGPSTRFRIERATDRWFSAKNTKVLGEVAGDVTWYTDPHLMPEPAYCYRVRAVREDGPSGVSESAWLSPDYAQGFTPDGLVFNGGAAVVDKVLRLTDGRLQEARSAFYRMKVDVCSFTTQFRFRITPASPWSGDGFTFCIQGGEPTAVGGSAWGLGSGTYAANQGIPRSAAVKFDLMSIDSYGPNSTGLYLNGDCPRNPGAIDLTPSGVDLHSGRSYDATLAYKDKKLTLTIVDVEDKAKRFAHVFDVDVPATAGALTACVGFTGGTGARSAQLDILSWTWTSRPAGD